MNGNTHKPHDCPHCWRVLYSKGALTNHINNEHWEILEAEAEVVEAKAWYDVTKEVADEPA
jgi:hypothetical protein